MNSRNLLRLVHGFALVGVFAWLYAGNLTPPSGPITSTMKTLDEQRELKRQKLELYEVGKDQEA